jgi:hypothetical protein
MQSRASLGGCEFPATIHAIPRGPPKRRSGTTSCRACGSRSGVSLGAGSVDRPLARERDSGTAPLRGGRSDGGCLCHPAWCVVDLAVPDGFDELGVVVLALGGVGLRELHRGHVDMPTTPVRSESTSALPAR